MTPRRTRRSTRTTRTRRARRRPPAASRPTRLPRATQTTSLGPASPARLASSCSSRQSRLSSSRRSAGSHRWASPPSRLRRTRRASSHRRAPALQDLAGPRSLVSWRCSECAALPVLLTPLAWLCSHAARPCCRARSRYRSRQPTRPPPSAIEAPLYHCPIPATRVSGRQRRRRCAAHCDANGPRNHVCTLPAHAR